jgi:uncharacterized membrane protein YgcG
MSNSLRSILSTLLNMMFLGIIFAFGIYVIGITFRSFRRSNHVNKKQQAIRTYSKQLGKLLQTRYGIRAKYTPAEVNATIKKSGYGTDYACYAIAMYSDYSDFMEYHRSIGESCNYETMRGEISECLFLSDPSFSPSEAIDAGDRFDSNGHQISSDNSSSYDGGGSHENPSSYDSSSSDGTSSSYGGSSYDSSSSGGGDYGGGGY